MGEEVVGKQDVEETVCVTDTKGGREGRRKGVTLLMREEVGCRDTRRVIK